MDIRAGDRVAIVTGGASQIGLGKAIALTLARQQCDVAILDVDIEGARQTAEEIRGLGRRAAAFKADISSSDEIRTAVEAVLSELGRVDVLVNNAGSASPPQLFHGQDEQDLDLIVDVILKGPMRMTHAVVNHMIGRGSGKIVNISSIVGINPQSNLCIYSAAKSGVVAFTRALAYELAPFGINVNGVAPGFVRTNFGGGPPAGMEEREIKETPLGRLTLAQDIANTVAFLASDLASALVGETIAVSGGRR